MTVVRILVATAALALSGVAFAQDQSALAQQDASIIDSLRAISADLTQPHLVDFYFTFKGEASAKAASEQMQQQDYVLVDLSPSPDEGLWQLQVQRSMVPELTGMNAASQALNAIARQHGGDYDGWSAIPPE